MKVYYIRNNKTMEFLSGRGTVWSKTNGTSYDKKCNAVAVAHSLIQKDNTLDLSVVVCGTPVYDSEPIRPQWAGYEPIDHDLIDPGEAQKPYPIKILRTETFPASFQPNWALAPRMGSIVVDERKNPGGAQIVYLVTDGKKEWLVIRDSDQSIPNRPISNVQESISDMTGATQEQIRDFIFKHDPSNSHILQ